MMTHRLSGTAFIARAIYNRQLAMAPWKNSKDPPF
jgi:hypothetical protein